MQLEKVDNIIFLKDIESNIMQEAFIVLKDNFKVTSLKTKEKKAKLEANIIKEAELIINEEINDVSKKKEKIKIEIIQKKYKFMKIINLVLIICILFLIII